MNPFAPSTPPPHTDELRNVVLKTVSSSTPSALLTVPAGKQWRVLAISFNSGTGPTTPKINGLDMSSTGSSSNNHHWGSRGLFYLGASGSIGWVSGKVINVGPETSQTPSQTESMYSSYVNAYALALAFMNESDHIATLSAGQSLQVGSSSGSTLQALVEELDL